MVSKGEERRRAKRLAVQEAFSFFMAVPAVLGMSRVYMRDVSTGGICFWTDSPQSFQSGQEIDLRLYTGPGLYLPLSAQVVRVKENEIAVQFKDPGAKAAKALERYLEFLDVIADAAVTEGEQAS